MYWKNYVEFNYHYKNNIYMYWLCWVYPRKESWGWQSCKNICYNAYKPSELVKIASALGESQREDIERQATSSSEYGFFPNLENFEAKACTVEMFWFHFC